MPALESHAGDAEGAQRHSLTNPGFLLVGSLPASLYFSQGLGLVSLAATRSHRILASLKARNVIQQRPETASFSFIPVPLLSAKCFYTV